jgi:hypothetical protein
MEQLDASLSGVNTELGLWDLDGTMITDDMRLLDGSIKLTADDIRALLEKYRHNLTMCRAIENYVVENEIDMDVPEEEPAPEEEPKPETPPDYLALYEKARADKNQVEALRIKRTAFENGVEIT